MEQIINQVINSFDFTLILVINVLTYLIIKLIDDSNGTKTPTTWQKRIIFVLVAINMGIVYNMCSDVSLIIIINSCIVAPVNWSWIIKPIANKLGVDYKQLNKLSYEI